MMPIACHDIIGLSAGECVEGRTKYWETGLRTSLRIIDIFPHIMTARVQQSLEEKSKDRRYAMQTRKTAPALFDLEERWRDLGQCEGLVEVLNINAPIEYMLDPKDAVEVARMANDDLAELVARFPDRFVAAIACLPLNDMDAALAETDRAIKELHFKGIRMHSSMNLKPMDSPEFFDLYEKMEQFDLPIWVHPVRDLDLPDYPGEKNSKYGMVHILGWPYETSLAMARLVSGGVMERFPRLNFITHHCGGMVPFFADRLAAMLSRSGNINPGKGTAAGSSPAGQLKRFYGDTVVHGNTSALMCGYDFFGADHLLFGTDYPSGGGGRRTNIDAVEKMHISRQDKEKIFSRNAEGLLHLQGLRK